ncbi:sulfite exporter TauE/SafE family protein [Caballeronia sp. LZ029]|uniref:sulfite exporter TauE/SafE family protein n=1 Tax=Caballeronia sp. LZ029 TaxID=3038564 RepID=UPI002861A10C|nr:sulfite exporter TauE/SafE family protein [Caballeronia sp. LZ029]MDR5744631.1 sulfite exporter TauE/SafE family protein [Caballeronia sp. LZ029]
MPTPGFVVIAFAAAVAGGFVRGASGFGGSLVMMPLLSLMTSPKFIVAPVLLLEAFAVLPVLRQFIGRAQWRVVMPICIAAFVALPFGAWALVNADQSLIRRAIGVLVLVFSLALLAGVRHKAQPRVPTSIALGLLSGALLGGTGIGGPPVILYLLSSSAPSVDTRANLMVTVMAMSVAALIVLWMRGAFMIDGPMPLWILAPGYLFGILAGMRLFGLIDERRFRRATLGFLVIVSVVTLAV